MGKVVLSTERVDTQRKLKQNVVYNMSYKHINHLLSSVMLSYCKSLNVRFYIQYLHLS